MTNPVTPSPDPWEVLRESLLDLHDLDHHFQDREAGEGCEDCLILLEPLTALTTRLEQAEALVAHADANCGCQAMSHAFSPTEEPTKDELTAECDHDSQFIDGHWRCLRCGRHPDDCPCGHTKDKTP